VSTWVSREPRCDRRFKEPSGIAGRQAVRVRKAGTEATRIQGGGFQSNVKGRTTADDADPEQESARPFQISPETFPPAATT
jgi:hypothetical protein